MSDENPPPNGGGGDASIDQDEDDFRKIMQQMSRGAAEGEEDLLGGIADRPLDIGEKADDAVDYEDISDDDLPDEEFDSGEGADSTQNFSGTTLQDSGGAVDNEDVTTMTTTITMISSAMTPVTLTRCKHLHNTKTILLLPSKTWSKKASTLSQRIRHSPLLATPLLVLHSKR